MPPSFSVTGGRPLKGTIRPAGNKNAALPILAATLLADGPCRIENVPHIRDVETMLELLAHLGVTVGWTGSNSVEVNAAPLSGRPPSTVSVLVPTPCTSAPRLPRNRARSWTWGSHAALRRVVVPRAVTAAISAFSVAVTLGSSRKISAPASRLASTW